MSLVALYLSYSVPGLTKEFWNYLTPSESAISLAVRKATQLESMKTANNLATHNGMYLAIDEANKRRAYQCKFFTLQDVC